MLWCLHTQITNLIAERIELLLSIFLSNAVLRPSAHRRCKIQTRVDNSRMICIGNDTGESPNCIIAMETNVPYWRIVSVVHKLLSWRHWRTVVNIKNMRKLVPFCTNNNKSRKMGQFSCKCTQCMRKRWVAATIGSLAKNVCLFLTNYLLYPFILLTPL